MEKTESQPKIDIPERHQEFCKAVARLCREYGVQSFGASYQPDFRDEWRGRIVLAWDQGRHGADAGKLTISSELQVHTSIDPKPSPAAQ